MYTIQIELTCGGYGRGYHTITEQKSPHNPVVFVSVKEARDYVAEHFPTKKTRIILLDTEMVGV